MTILINIALNVYLNARFKMRVRLDLINAYVRLYLHCQMAANEV